MKIKLLRNPKSSYGCKLTEGQTGDVDEVLAKALIDAKIAEPATSTPSEIKAVDSPAAIQASGSKKNS